MNIKRYSSTLKCFLSVIAMFIIFEPMQVNAQDASGIIPGLLNQFLVPSNNSYSQMTQQFLQNNPNFQQNHPAAYNQLINNPQAFFSNMSPNWQNQGYSNWSGVTSQQRAQQFLQNNPNFQQDHPNAYNKLINNPNAFFANRNNRENRKIWQNQSNPNWYGYNNQPQYDHRRYRNYYY